MKKNNSLKRFLAFLLSAVMVLSLTTPIMAAPEDSKAATAQISVQAQAITDYGFYGQKLSQVVLTYPEEVDPSSVTEDTYTVKDYPQAYTEGQKLAAPIEKVEVDGKQVTITIADQPELNEKGSSNPVGTLVVTNWYLNAAGVPVKGGRGYYHLDDVHTEVSYNGEVKSVSGKVLGSSDSDVIFMTEETKNNKFDEFERFDGVLPDANEQFDSIKAYVHVPEGAAEGTQKYPMVILGPGGQTTYHEEEVDSGLGDGSTMKLENSATALAMDYSCVGYLEAEEEMIIIALSTSNSKNIIAITEYFIDNMNADPDRVYLVGNSAGCTQCAAALKARPDLFAAYNNNNGGFTFPTWSEEEIDALVDNQVAVLFAAGETDNEKPRNNQNQYLELVERYRAAGYSEEWIQENVRIYGYPHTKFAPWGVTDHSATKVTYYYYRNAVYNNPESYYGHKGGILKAGSTYAMAGIKAGTSGEASDTLNYAGIPYTDFEYPVYGDMTVMEWMLSRKKPHSVNVISAKAVTDYGFYGQKLSQVILTYSDDVDPASVTKDSFTVKDYPQAYADGQKLAAPIDSVEVDGRQVIINIADVPELSESGSANPVGTLVITNWYLNAAGVPVKGGRGYYHLDDVHTEVYHNNTIKSMNGAVMATTASDAVLMTEKTKHNKFDEFEKFDGILPDANEQFDSIKAYIHLPEGAAEGVKKYPMVILGPGGQTTYHEEIVDSGLGDGSTMKLENSATALAMDYSCVGYLEADEDVIIIALSTSNSKNIIAITEYFIENMNADPTRVYLIGNSAGCTQSAAAIKARPDLFAAYNNNNGGFTFPTWTEEEIDALVENQVAVLFAAGETDNEKPRNNQNQYLELVDRYQKAGMSEDWIAENVRIYGYLHKKFAPWGVTDHSATKVTYYYYRNSVFTDPYSYYGHKGGTVKVGSTFTMPGIKAGTSGEAIDTLNYAGVPYTEFQYPVYDDMTVMEWVLSRAKTYTAQVESAKAVTDYGFYGQKLSQVILTYDKEVNPDSVSKDTFVVKDFPQAYANGQKLAAPIESVEVNGNQVIINIADVPELSESGSANPVGTMVITNWYLNEAGVPVKGGRGYYHLDDVHTEVYHNAAVLAADGSILATASSEAVTMMEETQHNKFDQFEKFDGILPDANEQFDSIKAYVHIPDGAKNGEGKYPMVILGPGGQTTYHEEIVDSGLGDGSTMKLENSATALAMDYSCVGYLEAEEDVIIIALSTSNSKNIIAITEYFIENMNADPNRVYLIGNSAGCTQSAAAIKARPDLFAAYNNNNGGFTFPTWTEEEIDALIENQVSVLFAAGETDNEKPRNNQNQYLELVARYRAAGMSEEWIAENVRIYGYLHDKFAPWGVTDHSATKVTYYYYRNNLFTTPFDYFGYEGEELTPGQTFTMPGIKAGTSGAASDTLNYAGVPYTEFQYPVYDDMTVMEWVLSRSKEVPKVDQTVSTSVASKITKADGSKGFKLGAKTTGDGELTYASSNKAVAAVNKKGEVTIKGTGRTVITIKAAETDRYNEASVTVTLIVVPKAGKIKKVKAGKNNLEVTVKQDKNCSGYEIQLSSSKKFDQAKTATILLKKNTKVTAVFKKLASKKSYYVRVRGYKTIKDKKYYGAYSSAEKTVTK
ncbi:MAG: prolyl oligopeptidase family serine peptidase [Clostridiales bacterium]|nr:prolyl oligopeptidase family serine peptidase [Clostridiales bacterium]